MRIHLYILENNATTIRVSCVRACLFVWTYKCLTFIFQLNNSFISFSTAIITIHLGKLNCKSHTKWEEKGNRMRQWRWAGHRRERRGLNVTNLNSSSSAAHTRSAARTLSIRIYIYWHCVCVTAFFPYALINKPYGSISLFLMNDCWLLLLLLLEYYIFVSAIISQNDSHIIQASNKKFIWKK